MKTMSNDQMDTASPSALAPPPVPLKTVPSNISLLPSMNQLPIQSYLWHPPGFLLIANMCPKHEGDKNGVILRKPALEWS